MFKRMKLLKLVQQITKKKVLSLLLAGLMVLPMVPVSVVSAAPAAPVTYYVSALGNDANNGRSIANAWASLAKVSSKTFYPGDTILFEGGKTFNGFLDLTTKTITGTKLLLITFSSYGTGRATINAGNGIGVWMTNGSYVKFDNLNFVGSGRKTGNTGTGIYALNSWGITLSNLDVSGFQHDGVMFQDSDDTNIMFVNSHDNGKGGFEFFGDNPENPALYHEGLYMGYCNAYNNPGDPTVLDNHSGSGVLIGQMRNVKIEYCTAYENGWDMPNLNGNGPAGIWCWQSDNVTIQNCIGYRNRTAEGKGDGDAFDFDIGMTNSTMQYNLAYENEGPGFLLCQAGNATEWKNNTLRYNISVDDGWRNGQCGILLWHDGAAMSDAKVYNNLILNRLPGGMGVNFYGFSLPQGKFYNNIFMTAGPHLKDTATSQSSFIGNTYFKIGGGFSSDGYTTFNSWATALNQEKLNGVVKGINAAPLLNNSTAKITITDPTKLATLFNDLKLKSTSPCIDRGLNLKSLFGIDPGTKDFYGNKIPLNGKFDIGAHEAK